jgi:hypothetical protein
VKEPMQTALGMMAYGLACIAAAWALVFASGCSVAIPTDDGFVEWALFDKLEGSDAQVSHSSVAGLGIGNIYAGRSEIDVFRVPGAADAETTVVRTLDAQGQLIETTITTKIGQYDK